MSENSGRFKNALFGFSRSDVINYIEQKALEHNEQRNELARKLDEAQKQLSSLQQKLADTEARLQASLDDADAKSSELEKLSLQLEDLKAENAELRDRNACLETELRNIRTERDSLADEVKDINLQKEEIELAKKHVADIELEAYARAKKIESSAIENANLAREALSNLILDAKRRFDRVRDDATHTLSQMASELDRLKEVLNHLPESFDSISGELDSLRFGNEKKNVAPEANIEGEDAVTEAFPEPDGPGMNDMAGPSEYPSVIYPLEDEDAGSPEISEVYDIPSDDANDAPHGGHENAIVSERQRNTGELLFFRSQKAGLLSDTEPAENDLGSFDYGNDDSGSTPGSHTEKRPETES